MKLSVNDQLIETRNQLLNEINSLTIEDLNRKLDDSTWSVSQICHHLFLTERVFTQSVVYGLKQGHPRKADPKTIHLAADRTQKANAPDMVVPGDVPLSFDQIVELLDESRAILFEVLDRIEDKSLLSERSVKHPLFGHLPLNQWIDLVYLHEQRHIEQIKEIKAQLK
ncbi:DinB family protein [Bacillus sp. MRMR6]|uniref:DinB family protein n=1 Tax=Bacillus sp. MRMR6 TaxID=1928617 RepID=UPI00095348EB|nr:DinB family protein [Bacillus sp. MRMR6]OLS41028.1 hypothetical protein BTR25_06815 [Bacillus sp. MRMR6]